jgi:steroid delta-isomerase-like uncharacterized protein
MAERATNTPAGTNSGLHHQFVTPCRITAPNVVVPGNWGAIRWSKAEHILPWRRRPVHILYAHQVQDEHLSQSQRDVVRSLSAERWKPMIDNGAPAVVGGHSQKDFASAQNWVTAFFEKGAEEVLGYYADGFVWEDIEFAQTITTKEDLYKAFVVFNNSGPTSPFGVHEFEMISYDGGVAPPRSKAQKRKGEALKGWDAGEFERLSGGILTGSDLEYDEWGYMQWVWKAGHNADFFGIPAKGKTTYTRGTTTQFYRDGKIVRCRTHWNFREFAMQLGVIPKPDEAWRDNKGRGEA